MTERELTPIEQAMHVLSRQAGAFNGVMTSCSQIHLPPARVEQALAYAQQRHPHLCSRITDTSGQLRFEAVEARPVPLTVLDQDATEDWQGVVRSELNQPIQPEQGMMRAVLIPGEPSYLITTLHPAIADKVGAARLHVEILTDCQTLLADQTVSPQPQPQPLTSFNDRLPASMQGSRGIEKAVGYLLRTQAQFAWKRPAALPFEEVVPIESRRCGLVHRSLDQVRTEALLNACEAAAVSLQDAVCAAMLLAVGDRLRADKTARSLRLSSQSYLDLRSHVQPAVTAEAFAVLESAVLALHTLKPQTTVWDLAQEVRQQIDISIQQGHIFSVAVMLKKIVEVYLKTPKAAPATVAVNLLHLPETAPASLTALNFAIGQKVYGGIFSATICLCRRQLFINFVYSDPSLGAATAQDLADQVLATLSQVDFPMPALAAVN